MKTIKKMFYLSIGLLVGITAINIFGFNLKENSKTTFKRKLVAGVVVWTEQSFSEGWFGDGFWQLRRRFEANENAANTTRQEVNLTYKTGATNYGYVVNQSIEYTSTERNGHNISINAKKKSKWLEQSVGYSFTKEYTVSYKASGTIPPRSYLYIYEGQVIIKEQNINVKVDQQRAANIFATRWKNTGKSWREDEKIREYQGKYIRFYSGSID